VSVSVSTNGSVQPSRRVAQAAGMISVQASCLIEEALAMMCDRAAEIRVTMDDVATAVLDRSIHLVA